MLMTSHKLAIGDIQLIFFSDGGGPLSEEGIAKTFNPLPEEALAAFQALPQPYTMSSTPVYLQTGGQHVLIDVGSGEGQLPEEGHLLAGMATEDITPDEIDTVILTHLHMDHFGGLRRADETATFPNAQVYVARAEWTHWLESGKAPAARVELLKAVFALYEGRVHLYESGEILAPGITALALPGHTPGHSGMLIESNGKRALHIVDALHVAIQMPYPDLSPVYDVDPVLSGQTRRMVLSRAASEHLLTFSYHLPFPGLGYIVHKGVAFAWDQV